ncbi:50S ribosomal protein L30 [Planctomycetaceae bacterium]|nr:50S ribosomal protein L30 [Planctomycetaceae bacterium]
MADMLKITQTRSIIEQLEAAKRTIKALGLGRPNYSVVKKDTPAIRGMLRKVAHLVRVEELKK